MDRCALCPGVNLCIEPDGPSDAEILFIGEAPGKDENRKNRVFIGKTGDEVNRHYLPLAGLRREHVCFTNAIRCLPTSAGGKLDPTRQADLALLESCSAKHLYPLIERLQPKLIVPLGAFACRSMGLLQETTLELHHGIPCESVWGIPAFPMYHPALGIHEPKKMLYIRTDWVRLKDYLAGRLHLPSDPYGNPDYQEVTDVSQLGDLEPTIPMALDTESTRKREPFCLTGSQHPGSGWLIRAERKDLLDKLNSILESWESEILFHNWLYDWPVTAHMGLRIPHKRVVDTMARVFHLGNLPQGLKALAARELGMTMQDFIDVVGPHSTRNVMHYFRMALGIDWPKPDEEMTQDSATGAWKLYKPQGMNTKLKRFFTDVEKGREKDVFKAWENWEAHHAQVEAELGEYPGMCISHVPFQQVIHYACRDADALIRLWPILKRMSHQVRKHPQEKWRAA